ncbi:MAG: tRNA (cytidine(34)-2'-O)-methyltransferase [Pseudomonadota bacterium]
MSNSTHQEAFDLALYQPDIPGNTGTLMRFCACTGIPLHIIEPAGFRLDDRSLKRAGMDYLQIANLERHPSWDAFVAWAKDQNRRLILSTTRAETDYCSFGFEQRDILLMGRESSGVPPEVHETCQNRIKIEMASDTRSLNVALAAAMIAGEALRQLG